MLGELQRVAPALAFERAARDPERAQRAVLERTMAAIGASAYGVAHGLAGVRSLADLQARAPVTTYADVAPWVRRQMAGERAVLALEEPIFFASSTGTTGEPKLTPVTPTFRKDFQRTLLVSMAQVAMRHPAAFTGTVAYFVGKWDEGRTESGLPIGFTSGFNYVTLPRAIQKLYVWPYELFTVADFEARAHLAALLAATSPVSLVAGIFPLALLAWARTIEPWAERLARDLRTGTLSSDLALTDGERDFFARRIGRDARAADRLEAGARANGGRLPLWVVMPRLRLVYCWSSASAGHYIPELRERLGGRAVVRDAVYAANEGWGNCTFGEDVLGGPVAVTSHFFEYVEEDAWERGVREGVGAHALEVGRRYRVLLTTTAGLVRYDVGDLVECNGVYRRTPRVAFARRAGAAFNLVGEKVAEPHVVAAVREALDARGRRAELFTAVPRFEPAPHWELWLELEGAVPDDDALEALRASVDAALCRAAADYALYRRARTLAPVSLRVIAPGEHARVRREAVAAGRPEAQLKVQNLLPDPDASLPYRVARAVEAPGDAARPC